MTSNPPKASASERIPDPLPSELIVERLRERPILLFLDYDGTISEIVSDPAKARPLSEIRAILPELTRRPDRLVVAIVSGRELSELRRLLDVDCALTMVGTHGLEFLTPQGTCERVPGVDESLGQLQSVREWLSANIPAGAGFIVEDKNLALALHYRNAPAALAIKTREAFEAFVEHAAPSLKLRHGKMVVEAIPRIASKGTAVRTLCDRAAADVVPVYFGDDLTDEDAFVALADHGITVLVGSPRRSSARYNVDSPSAVARVLVLIARELTKSNMDLRRKDDSFYK